MDNYQKMRKSKDSHDESVMLFNNITYKKQSANRLLKILYTKMRTTFIGALSQCEDNFGHLWGHNKNDNELTKSEKQWKEVWDVVRNNILNNGNAQYRAMEKELGEYDIVWKRHTLQLPILDMKAEEHNEK